MNDHAELIERALFLAAGQDDPHSVTITELCDALSRQRDELAALSKDAERYRWLRDNQVFSSQTEANHYKAIEIAVEMSGLEWDAAIDAAIAAKEGA